ncbi:MAG TPA: Crp/Fnr family transcriptional regulator [Casimicrobiaceae bacterium]|jgi:CRP-like cAMP-binding protein|nr:Crp/Fnr family transcriptional regulator [Casimicrobiaceae bacterium]
MPPKIRTQSFLANLPLFKELAPAEIDRLAAGTTELFVPRGEIVFQRGDPCVGFHAVVYGQVKLSFVTPQGGEKVVEIISPGFTFGEALMFMDKPYIVMAQALSDTLLLHVAKEAVFHGIEHDPGFARRMLAGLSRRVHALMADVESYSLQSGTQRVIGYLLRQEAEGGEGQASYTVRLPTSKSIVASRLNLTPEHFSRILHELVDRGLVAVEGRDVRIVDAQKLRDYTG